MSLQGQDGALWSWPESCAVVSLGLVSQAEGKPLPCHFMFLMTPIFEQLMHFEISAGEGAARVGVSLPGGAAQQGRQS